MPDSLVSPGKVLNAVTQTAELGVSGYGGVAIQVQGTFSATVVFEATVHGSEWVPFSVTEPDNTTRVTSTTAAGVFVGSTVGFTAVRARMSAWSSGGASVILRADVASPGSGGGGGGSGTDVNLVSVGGESIALGQAAMAASLPVVIASNQTAIPITGSITADNNAAGPVGDPIPADASSTAYEGPTGNLETLKLESFDYDTSGSSQPQTVLGIATPASGGPLPVPGGSGTATGALRVELPTNGTGVIATVAAVTAITNALPAGTNVIGHVIADTGSTTAVTGNVTVVQPTGTNLHVVLDSGTLTTVSTVTAVTAITNALPAGNNNIGDVDVASLPALAAGTALIGKVAASAETSTVYDGTTALTPKFAKIAASSSGDNTLVAAVTSKKIRVLGYNFIANGTVNVKFQSGAAGTDLTGLKYCVANMGLSASYSPIGWFETASGVLLNLNLSAGVAVGGELVYVEV